MKSAAADRSSSSSGRPHYNGRRNSHLEGSTVSDKPRHGTRTPSVPLRKQHQLEIGVQNKNEEIDGANSDTDSTPSFGSDLYKDEDDKAQLEKMSELEREMILAERSTRRDDYHLKKMVKSREEQTKLPKGGSSRISWGARMQKDISPLPLMVAARVSAERTSKRGIEKSAAARSALEELRAHRMHQQDSQGYHNRFKNLFADGFSSPDRSFFVI
jgi:RNA polymerase-associated protein RTF1